MGATVTGRAEDSPRTTGTSVTGLTPGQGFLALRTLGARPFSTALGLVARPEGLRGRWAVTDQPAPEFAGLLRELRVAAGLTQEDLAEAAGLSPRTVSDLERGVSRRAHKDTARLLADALHLTGPARARFEAVARGRDPGGAGPGAAAVATRTLPRDIASFTGRQQELEQLAEAAAGAGGVVSIHAIGGMAGVGKTAFAVHARLPADERRNVDRLRACLIPLGPCTIAQPSSSWCPRTM